MAFDKIRFICSICGQESWFRVDLDGYIVKASDLVCDDCIPEDPEIDFKIESIIIVEE